MSQLDAVIKLVSVVYKDNFVSVFQFYTVSDAPKSSVVAKKFPSYNPDIKSDQQKKEEV